MGDPRCTGSANRTTSKALALFLASPASEYITGQEIVIDGGWGLGVADRGGPERRRCSRSWTTTAAQLAVSAAMLVSYARSKICSIGRLRSFSASTSTPHGPS